MQDDAVYMHCLLVHNLHAVFQANGPLHLLLQTQSINVLQDWGLDLVKLPAVSTFPIHPDTDS